MFDEFYEFALRVTELLIRHKLKEIFLEFSHIVLLYFKSY